MIKHIISSDWMLNAPGTNGNVNLPNDYAVNQDRDPNTPSRAANGFHRGGNGIYTKYLNLEDDGVHRILDIDGAYMCSTVTFNENLLTLHPYGYTPILCDLTEYQCKGTNKLVVTANDMQPSTRWYSGAGIYRDVFIWEGGKVRIEPNDLFVTTPTSDGNVCLSITLTSDIDTEITLALAAFDGEDEVCASSSCFKVSKGKNGCAAALKVPSPKLWSPETPYLYTVRAAVCAGDGSVYDTYETAFGIRTISFDTQNGFRLNGKTLKMRGGCIHHDHGALGAAAYPAAEERKIRLLKEAGFNAVRTAHNPPSLALLEACDRLGMLVMDEAFDMWQKPKSFYDYHLWFADKYADDIEAMVKRDRNHPCVVSYSIGNEVPESTGVGMGPHWSKVLSDEVRKHDSTRPVSVSTFGTRAWYNENDPDDYKAYYREKYLAESDDEKQRESWTKRTADIFAPCDIAGYNYLFERYERDGVTFPNRVIWGSETHAVKFYDSWHETLRLNHVIGDFTWTAYDNMGEAGTGRAIWERDGVIKGISLAEWPWRNCYQGDLDLCGYRRPQSYFREAVWLGTAEPKIFTTHPEHYGEG
nr:glycoside hydrolase family 2 protein [Clostridia bacterium]